MTNTELDGMEVPAFDQDTELLRLAELDRPDYLNKRNEAAKMFDWPKSELDKVVEGLRTKTRDNSGPGDRIAFTEIEPWNYPVDGNQLLEDITKGIRRFVAMDETAIHAVAAWCLFTHAFDAFEISPRLFFTSPEKRCGKTTALKVINKIVRKPMLASNTSPSAMFRLADAEQPTIMLDEADGYIKENEDFRNLINAGHEIDNCKVIRVTGEGTNMVPTVFRIWVPFVIAGIGKLQSTIEDRSIIIRMRRRLGNEKVENARRKNLKSLEIFARKAARWGADNIERLKGMEPAIPDSLNDRACDNWEPLLSIADVIGGEWPDKLREAAVALELAADEDDDASAGVMLLSDCWQIFEEENTGRISSKNLIVSLNDLEGRPWCEWRRGNPITQNGVSRLLKIFGIAPSQMRIGGSKVRGYEMSRFAEPYNRYAQIEKTSPDALTPNSKRYTGTNGSELPKTGTLQPVQDSEVYRLQNPKNPQNTNVCTGVPLEKGDMGQKRENAENTEPSNAWKDQV